MMFKHILIWVAEGVVVAVMACLVGYSLIVFSGEYHKPYTVAGCAK